jgi:cobalt/nickel transport protein
MSPQTQTAPKKIDKRAVVVGIFLIVLLMAVPLLVLKDTEFGGSDGAGSEAITAIAPDYDSEWISNWWEPPGGETESALFALQAAIGGILIGYALGYLRGRQKGQQMTGDANSDSKAQG